MEECLQQRKIIANEFKECLPIFSALGDETRQHIFIAILANSQVGIRVPEITKLTHLSRPAVSHHLKILKDANVINMKRIGTKNYYYVNADTSDWNLFKRLIDDVCMVIPKAMEAGYPYINSDD